MSITEVSTRRNSEIYQLRRFVHLKPVIQFKCDKDPILHQYKLADTKWDFIEPITVFLKPFYVANKQVSSSAYPTFVDVMPVYEWLMARLEAVITFIFCDFIFF